MLENGRGLIKALENWARNVTTGYKDVNVSDLSVSFRDGLAFCAIIHHYRPDLINFESLSKENILENNSLAFGVAEKQLGVPALLDAEDMVKYAHPDRLSIITYLSQLRNCFVNQNKVNKRLDLKRIQKNVPGPPTKVSVVQPPLTSAIRHEVCQVCKNRVFILERLIVDGKLYHTTCFRCHKCNTLLNPGAYVEGDISGTYECSVCLRDEAPETLESVADVTEGQKDSEEVRDTKTVLKYVPVPTEFASKEAVNFARSNLFQEPSDVPAYPLKASGMSIKDKINAFERNQVNEKTFTPASSIPVTFGTKVCHSPVFSNHSETQSSVLLDGFSVQQSLISTRSSEKCDHEFEKRSSLNKLSAKESEPEDILEGKNGKEAKINNIRIQLQDSCDSNVNVSLCEADLRISADDEMKNLNNENISIAKCDSKSPVKVTRDIFKSSLSPLKLSLSSTLRKEPSDLKVTSSDCQKPFDIPQVKSSYPVTLPRSGFGRSLSVMKQPVEIKGSRSESNLNDNIMPQARRSSLESSTESGDKEFQKTLLGTNSKSFQRTISSIEVSSSSDIYNTKTSLKNYSPVYKSLYNTSSLADRISSKIASDDSCNSLQASNEIIPKVTSEIKQESEKDLSISDASNCMVNHDIKPKLEQMTEILAIESDKDLEVPVVCSAYPETSLQEPEEKDYPDDLNPFGEEGNDKDEEYPDDLNPFGDDEEIANNTSIAVVDYDESKNPFASDEDEHETTGNRLAYSPRPNDFGNQTPNLNNSISSNMSSPSGSLKGTIKKRQAPRPPNVSDIFSKDSEGLGKDSISIISKTSPSVSKKSFQTSSPKVRKNKPAPPPPPVMSCVQDLAANVKITKEADNMKLRSLVTEDKQLPKQPKKKKRPAPPVPITIRRDMKKIPLKEIVQEMKEIEEKQREYERQGREIELLIRDRDKDEEPSVEEEEYIMQLFELVNQKNALFRRQAELMYIKRSQRLEEQQFQIEKEIRQLMEKPESEKTDEDRQKEEELTMELIDIVDQRNSIIDSIEMDRRRELEEDHSVQEQLEIKNGDLITAEIKQKIGKSKKSKGKKEKKKHTEEESGKGTLRKKRHLFTKRS